MGVGKSRPPEGPRRPDAKGREPGAPLRLNRFLARAGFGSRRGVEELIRAGRIRINGAVVTSLSARVDPAADRVTADGRPLVLPAAWQVYAFHKPLGVVSTLRAQGGARSLLDFRRAADLPARLVPVGRLDADTSGLLLWTDDGDLAQALMRPRSAVWKRYEATLDAPLDAAGARALADGKLSLDGRPSRPARVRALPGPAGRRWAIELQEGRYRQVRRMFALLGLDVVRLHRTRFGPLGLGRLPAGAFRLLKPAEVAALRRAAGIP